MLRRRLRKFLVPPGRRLPSTLRPMEGTAAPRAFAIRLSALQLQELDDVPVRVFHHRVAKPGRIGWLSDDRDTQIDERSNRPVDVRHPQYEPTVGVAALVRGRALG